MWLLLIACTWIDPPVVEAVVGPDPGAERHVWLFRQQPDGRFLRDEEPLAHSLSSLGLEVVEEALVLTAVGVWLGSVSEWRREWWGPPVHALRTVDLETWEPLLWRLSGDTLDRVQAARDGLERASLPLAAVLMDSVAKQALKGRTLDQV